MNERNVKQTKRKRNKTEERMKLQQTERKSKHTSCAFVWTKMFRPHSNGKRKNIALNNESSLVELNKRNKQTQATSEMKEHKTIASDQFKLKCNQKPLC